jgi:hypothetical protein
MLQRAQLGVGKYEAKIFEISTALGTSLAACTKPYNGRSLARLFLIPPPAQMSGSRSPDQTVGAGRWPVALGQYELSSYICTSGTVRLCRRPTSLLIMRRPE